MPILSLEFVLFFLLFFPIYWGLKSNVKLQNLWLLAVSLGLLVYLSPAFALNVVGFSFFITVISVFITKLKNNKLRAFATGFGILGSLVFLSVFKFFDEFKLFVTQYLGDNFDLIMPLGISYYVFQSITYLVTVYKNPNLKLSWHNLLLYFSFFLTITAGPILRAENHEEKKETQYGSIEQLNAKRRNFIYPALAINLVLLGIVKKWWLAGTLDITLVDPVFSNPQQYDVLTILAAIYAYTFQLFFDFSGYSDLVIGLAMLLGIQLPQNFNLPLIAHNLREFWNRWHISLSTWIRDYIYIPLGGSRKPFIWIQINLMIAMVASGVWHGAGWGFFIWGALHGLGLVLLNIGDKIWGGRNKLSNVHPFLKYFSMFITFNFVCFSFIIFKENNLDNIKLIIEQLYTGEIKVPDLYVSSFLLLVVLYLIFGDWLAKLFKQWVKLFDLLPTLVWILPIILVAILVMVLSPSGILGFIYANF